MGSSRTAVPHEASLWCQAGLLSLTRLHCGVRQDYCPSCGFTVVSGRTAVILPSSSSVLQRAVLALPDHGSGAEPGAEDVVHRVLDLSADYQVSVLEEPVEP